MIQHNTGKDVALDLETLGVVPGCVVLSIGAVTLDLKAQFYTTIEIASCEAVGLHSDKATADWWAIQDDFAYNESHLGVTELIYALNHFSIWWQDNTVEGSCIWGNGAAFDAPILAAAYKACGLTPPWDFHNERCFRTMRAMYPQVAAPEFIGTKHVAIHDAAHEAKHLSAILQHMYKELPHVS